MDAAAGARGSGQAPPQGAAGVPSASWKIEGSLRSRASSDGRRRRRRPRIAEVGTASKPALRDNHRSTRDGPDRRRRAPPRGHPKRRGSPAGGLPLTRPSPARTRTSSRAPGSPPTTHRSTPPIHRHSHPTWQGHLDWIDDRAYQLHHHHSDWRGLADHCPTGGPLIEPRGDLMTACAGQGWFRATGDRTTRQTGGE